MTPPSLFEPLRVGAWSLRNRIVMAPLTRSRAAPGNVPGPLAATYYRQRASAGLIISEALPVCPEGHGYLWTPGIYTREQVAGWQPVTAAVHEAGGTIVAQLWHVGRISHTSLQPGGQAPVGASDAVAASSFSFALDAAGNPGQQPCSPPRALSTAEAAAIGARYGEAAANAREAGFDGVEIHGANGYLPHQFLNSAVNTRSDAYGGSIANRARLLLEAVDAAIAAIGADRVGVRLSPGAVLHDLPPVDDELATYTYVAEQLAARQVAYLHLKDHHGAYGTPGLSDALLHAVRSAYRGPIILCGGLDRARCEAALARGDGELFAFGRAFIANPDLPFRLEHGKPLARASSATFYGGGEAGYTDYPAWSDAPAA